ncbi:MAG: putative endonuclease [Psychromonas sp.]|jgi:putative endonuclease|uniref:GIY-YIG nuclease family protein n=1 Tax=Psychromonas sp. TaxID=1884585 RepID=UPI0039E5477F
MPEKQPAIYILSNKKGGVLYIGVTSNLAKRVYQHQTHQDDGFSKKYNLNDLVYFEMHSDMLDAISREKQLKHWNREWKIRLIEKANPEWLDLSKSIL